MSDRLHDRGLPQGEPRDAEHRVCHPRPWEIRSFAEQGTLARLLATPPWAEEETDSCLVAVTGL